MKLLLLATLLACNLAHAEEWSPGQIATIEGFALKWERDANTLMGGDMPGDRRENMGRGLAFLRAAYEMRLMLNRPRPPYTRATQPKAWPPTDQRGTPKLLDLILPGEQTVKAESVEREMRPGEAR